MIILIVLVIMGIIGFVAFFSIVASYFIALSISVARYANRKRIQRKMEQRKNGKE